MRRTLAIIAAALLAVCTVGVSVAASAPAEPAKAYGGCVSKSTGYLRVLERAHLSSSVNGKCKSTETKITWYSRTGVPKPVPTTIVYKLGPVSANCTRDASSTSTAWSYTCTTATASPSPSPSSS